MKRFETKWIALIIGLLLIAIFATVLTYPKKYKVGMSWEEVVTLAKPETLKLNSSGLETNGIPKEQLEKEVAYSAYDTRAGILIDFNYRKKVIGVQRWKYFGIDFPLLIYRLKRH